MFFMATEIANGDDSPYTPARTHISVFKAKSIEALADYFALEASSYFSEGGSTVVFKEISEAEASIMSLKHSHSSV